MEKNKKKGFLARLFSKQETGIFVIFIVLCAVISIIAPKFLKPQNIINILRQISNVGIMAVGEAMVIIIAGIDLSVGSVLSMGACSLAVLSQSMNPWIAMVIALLIGALVGVINGMLTVKIGIAPFIATLGTQMMCKGFAYIITNGIPVKFSYPNSVGFLGGGSIAIGGVTVPMSIAFMLVIYVIGIILLTKTVFGRELYAVGDNEHSAKLSGINAERIKVTAYVISGVLAALAGVLNAGNLTTATADAGDGIESNVIAAVVIGGVSMSGGQGRLIMVVVGVLIMGILTNGMTMLTINEYVQQFIKGLVLIGAVALDSFIKEQRSKQKA